MDFDKNDAYRKMIQEVDEHITDPQDAEFAKNQMYQLSMMFIDELQAMSEQYEDRINALAQNQNELEEKIKKIEKKVKRN